MILDAVKAAFLLFVALLVQVAFLDPYSPLGGTADLLLVALISIALLRGSVFGALAGFCAGFLIDTSNLGTLGFTSLLLTLAGYWTGRYGETTARDRFHAPYLSVAVITVLYGVGTLGLHFFLGQPAPGRPVPDGASRHRAAEPHHHVAGLRARPQALPAGRRARPRPRGEAPWLASRARAASCRATRASRSPTGSRRSSPSASRSSGPSRSPCSRCSSCGCGRSRCSRARSTSEEASDNRVRNISVDAPRGWIVDRYGHPLVENAVGTSLVVWPADLPRYRKARAAELNALSMVASMPVKEIVARMKPYANDPLTPVVLRRGIQATSDQYLYLKEHQRQFPGVELDGSYVRRYPHQSLLAQVLGYVGPIGPAQVKAAKKAGYQPQDVMGQAGIEQSYDRYLKGKDGVDQLTVNSLGQPTSPIKPTVVPTQGNTLRLTIDIRLQRAAERALASEIRAARVAGETYADGGAIVALDPRNGAVLAMASNPTYQPSVYVSRDASKLAPLLNAKVAAEKNSPSLNRAIDGFYPPGSVWKPVTALAAMQEGILSPTESLQCTPSFTFYQQTFHNWDPYVDQPMELGQALAESCDTYFYRVGQRFYDLPSNRGATLQLWASRFGFGSDTGIDIGPENPGLVPTPDWRCRHFGGPPCAGYIDRIWKPGYEVQPRDRPGRPRGDAPSDGALLRDDRERRPDGHAAHRAGRRDARWATRASPTCCACSRRSSPPRAASTRRRSRPSSRGSGSAPTPCTAPPTASSGSSRSRSPGRRARPRRT